MFSTDNDPWTGSVKYAKVRGREDVGTVIQPGVNINRTYCFALLFPSTGEVAYYQSSDCTRCDKDGKTQSHNG